MATRGDRFTFHGAFNRKADAERKVKKLGGSGKARILSLYVTRRSYRYLVVTK